MSFDPPHNGEPMTPAVTRAVTTLRERVEPGWVDARDRILAAAMSATRNTWPLALRGAPNQFVSDQVVISQMRALVDAVPHAKALTIVLEPTDDHLTRATIGVGVEYAHPIRPIVDDIRVGLTALLDELLAHHPPTGAAALNIYVGEAYEPDS